MFEIDKKKGRTYCCNLNQVCLSALSVTREFIYLKVFKEELKYSYLCRLPGLLGNPCRHLLRHIFSYSSDLYFDRIGTDSKGENKKSQEEDEDEEEDEMMKKENTK